MCIAFPEVHFPINCPDYVLIVWRSLGRKWSFGSSSYFIGVESLCLGSKRPQIRAYWEAFAGTFETGRQVFSTDK